MGIVKEVKRTVNVAWSPKQIQRIMLAGGTVAQQLDSTFSTNAHIEIFSLDLTEPGRDLQCMGKIQSKSRFHKLLWSAMGIDGPHPHGIVIAGSDNGIVTFWDADKILHSDSNGALITQSNHHVGAVRSLDVNPFQANLIASGASESEIYIWDLNNPSTPMSPGNKLHPLEDISCVAWNRQAQHILGSTSPSGRSVVWDLRKNEPIIQVSDSNAKSNCKALCWHPDIPTQLVTGSEDDRSPVIQLWDLRFATSPTRTLERHKRGILSLSWCQQDADLLLSAAKDNQVLCWNPNTNVPEGEVVYQLPVTSQWIFECLWCPRNPDIICTTSFDGHVTLYSLLGGGSAGENDSSEPSTPTQIDSTDPFANIASAQKKGVKVEEKPLKMPPKWFRRPCAASFGFGGHLVSFGSKGRSVGISQVVTEPNLLKQSNDFELAVQNKNFIEHCNMKVGKVKTQKEKKIWNFLKATFDGDPRKQYLQLLGYDPEELEKQFAIIPESSSLTIDGMADKLQEKLATLPLEEDDEASKQSNSTNDDGGSNTTAKLFGSDGGGTEGSRSPFDEIGMDPSLDFTPSRSLTNGGSIDSISSISLHTGDDSDGLLTKALLIGNFQAAVNICINTDRMAEALILAVAGGSDLYESTRQRFLKQRDCQITKLISLVTNKNWSDIVKSGSLDNWEEVLASLVTYATPNEFSTLCSDLGQRLEDAGRFDDATLCYICSGNIEKFVNCWLVSVGHSLEPLSLHDLIEKVILLRQAIYKKTRNDPVPFTSSMLTDKIRSYADLLAAQGSLTTALAYLELTATPSQGQGSILRDRLYHSIGTAAAAGGREPPPFPFDRVDPSSSPAPTQPITQYTPTSSSAPFTSAINTSTAQDPVNPYHNHVSKYGRAGYGVSGNKTVLTNNTTPQPLNNPFITTTQPVVNHHVGGVPTPMPPQPLVTHHPPLRHNHGGHTNNYPPIVGGPHGGGSVPIVGGPHGGGSVPIVGGPHGGGAGTPPPKVFTPPTTTTSVGSYPPQPKDTSVAPPPTGPATAWNDPPMITKHKKTTSHAPPTPITTPLAPVPMDSVQPLVPIGDQVGGVKPPTPTDMKAPNSPITPVEKKPIPSEHSLIPNVLEGMLSQCRARANNTATKRKLDEISRKLEILSDLLRESRLSPDVLQGLHFIAQDCQSMNYHPALGKLNLMVANSNLSEISSFFPGIKTLLQLSIQLRI